MLLKLFIIACLIFYRYLEKSLPLSEKIVSEQLSSKWTFNILDDNGVRTVLQDIHRVENYKEKTEMCMCVLVYYIYIYQNTDMCMCVLVYYNIIHIYQNTDMCMCVLVYYIYIKRLVYVHVY